MIRVVLIAVVLATTAHAQAPDRAAEARAAADAGAALFNANDYAGAVAKFKEAYELDADPSYLFNIAQAYRHANDCVNAADYYGRFLAEVTDPPNAEKIRGWYAQQSECAKQRKTPPPSEPPPPPPPTEPTSGRPLGLTLALAGVSVASFAVGGFFVWDANYLGKQRDSVLAMCSVAQPCSSAAVNDYDRRGSRANTIAAIGFAVGGVALAASATVYLLTGRESDSSVAITPIEGGAIVAGGFRY